ncbi:MAG: hypothetical protein HYZ42_00535 [Bacteroidetes bacterium]|nr:hypothetical protein [Bacteroidota bacterium]
MMYDYTQVIEDIPAILNCIVFKSEQSYVDFVDTDSVASYGINYFLNQTLDHEESFVARYKIWLLAAGFLFISILIFLFVKKK